MGALKKAVLPASKPKSLKAKPAKKAASRAVSPKVLAARTRRAVLERGRNETLLKRFEAGEPVSRLCSSYKISEGAVYQRLCRARNSLVKTQTALAVVQPTLVAAPQPSEMSEMTQVAFLRGRIQQLEAMLKQVLAILSTRKLQGA